jgi:hypothetical protein
MFWIRLVVYILLIGLVFIGAGILIALSMLILLCLFEGYHQFLKYRAPYIFEIENNKDLELCKHESEPWHVNQEDLDQLKFSDEPITLEEAILVQKISNNDYEALYVFLKTRCTDKNFPFEDAPLELLESLMDKIVKDINNSLEHKQQKRKDDLFFDTFNKIDPKQIH